MRIERDNDNSFTLAARPTLTPSKWLLRFTRVDDATVEQLCIATAIANAGLPVLLTFTEVAASPDPLAAEVTLNPGQWQLKVYEQTSTTNLNYTLTGREVYDVLVQVEGAAAPDPEPTNPCSGECDVCEVVNASDASEVVACVVANGDVPVYVCEILATDEATPDIIVECLGDKTEGVEALLCGTCDPLSIAVNGTAYTDVVDPCGGFIDIPIYDRDGTVVPTTINLDDPEFPMVMVDDLPCDPCLMTVRIYVNGVLNQTIDDVNPCEDNTVNIHP